MDVTAKAGVRDGRWSTGAAFGDYDGDGFVDLMVTNYVDIHLTIFQSLEALLIASIADSTCSAARAA